MFRIAHKAQRAGALFVGMLVLVLASAMPLAHSQTTSQPGKTGSPAAQAAANLLDINTASAAELKALPGIGDAYSQRIIAGRPYTAKNQLVQRGIIPQATYEKISARIIAHRPK